MTRFLLKASWSFAILLFTNLSFISPVHNPSTTNQWKFKKEVDGITVYTKDVEGSNLKELKITLLIKDVNFSQIVSFLNDTNGYKKWLYKCTEAKNLAVKNEQSSIDYYVFDFPWPMSDRDFVSTSTMWQDEHTNDLIVLTEAIDNYQVLDEDMVRINEHVNKWVFHKIDDHSVQLTYTVKSNPGGNIPDWIVNLAIDHGPTKSLKGLRSKIQDNKYKTEVIDWVVE